MALLWLPCCLLALLSKEQGIIAPMICVVYDVFVVCQLTPLQAIRTVVFGTSDTIAPPRQKDSQPPRALEKGSKAEQKIAKQAQQPTSIDDELWTVNNKYYVGWVNSVRVRVWQMGLFTSVLLVARLALNYGGHILLNPFEHQAVFHPGCTPHPHHSSSFLRI